MKTLFPGFLYVKTLILSILFAVAFDLSVPAQPAILESDSLALVALYNATDGDNWTHNDNWLTGPVNSWWGITVDGYYVTRINLLISDSLGIGNNLVGSIPNDIGNLTHLVKLELSFNQLSGNIPPEIWHLTNLIFLGLWGQQLTGEIPDEIGQLINLVVLILYGNQLTGSIPHEIGLLTKLSHLELGGGNHLSDTIPAEIWQLRNLNYLDLSGNQLIGNIPGEIGNLTQLSQLGLGGNQLSGNIPSEIGQLTNLKRLYLANNQLNGAIPSEIWQLTNLVGLDLRANQLNGTIPIEIGNLSNLSNLDLSYNQLSGNIPAEIGLLSNLTTFELWDNQLNGKIPPEIGMLTNLTILRLTDNQLRDTIPDEIWKLTNLTYLDLGVNQLIGKIPVEIGQLKKLTHFSLGGNQIYGTIPPEIGQLTSLILLDLSGNQLNGEIPSELGNLINLQEIRLISNQLTGEFPSGSSNFKNLHWLQLENNSINELPVLSNVDSVLYCSNNRLTFEDFELNLELINKPEVQFNYVPQLPFGRDYDTTAIEGNQFELSIFCGGKFNHYKWYKDGELQLGFPDTSCVVFPSIKLENAGTYYITVTNDSVPDLELTSLPVHLNVLEPCMKRDSLALVALYWATDGDHWTHNDNWLTGPVSSWWGITTDGCNVLEVELVTETNDYLGIYTGNNLRGMIPPEIGNLLQLRNLILHTNELYGIIPPEIGNLDSLRILRLGRNQLSGGIPAEIGNLSKLEMLELSNNQLTGEIPPEIGNLAELTNLGLENNQLSGNIPDEFYNLHNLFFCWLGDNQLSGEISPRIGELLRLGGLGLRNNQLGGIIPPEIGLLTDLQTLHLGNNLITGEIPHEIGNLTELIFLVLGGDRSPLTGEIPREFYDLKKLQWVWLSGNNLTGELNSQLGELTELVYLFLDGNLLTGTIPNEIGNLTNLKYLSLCYNQFTGKIPEVINTFPSLEYLRIQDNYFDEIPDLSLVDSTNCSNNQLTFEDFEQNLNAINNPVIYFNYSPQRLFGRDYDTTVIEGNRFELSIFCGGKYNHYKWYKDGVFQPGFPDTSCIVFQSIKLENAGTYYITVTNDSVPGLELTSLPVTLYVLDKNFRNCTIRAYIDGQSQLVIQSNTVQWHHLNSAAPGRHVGNNYPTYICGLEWYPTWPDIPDSENRQECISSVLSNPIFSLPEFTQNVNITIVQAEGNAYILQQPAADNDFTLIIFFDDGPPPGANWYEISIFWSLIEAPEKPILISPVNNEINQPLSVSLVWNQAQRTDYYILQVSTSNNFNTINTEESGIKGTSFSVENLIEKTKYYWRIGAVNEADTIWSEVWNFTTQPKIPEIPVLDSPENGISVLPGEVRFDWSYSTDAEKYQIQVSTTPDFSIINFEESLISVTSITIENIQENTTFYWRVCASNYSGTSGWSEIWEFMTKKTIIDLVPVNLVVIDGTHNPQFMVPGIEYFPDNNLKMFNRWGILIYEKTGYRNELDMTGYPAGTYFYILAVKSETDQKLLKSFVDVVKN